MTYRAPDEVALARANADPLRSFRQRVVEASLLQAGDFDAVDKETVATIARGARRGEGGADADAKRICMTDVYLNY